MTSTVRKMLPAALDLTGKRVAVTGAASGIGRSTATILAELGAELLLVDMNSPEATGADISAIGGYYQTLQGDLASETFREEILKQGPFHALAHCAAFFNRPGWRSDLSDKDRFHLLMEVNVRAPLQLASGCIDQMAQRGGGYIVLVGSAAGRNGGGIAGGTPPEYAASKGGVHTLVRSLSRRAVGHNILVNGVAPGPVATPLSAGLPFDASALPLGRMGQPEEIGWIIALLCTSAGAYMSGAIVDVNGGAFVG